MKTLTAQKHPDKAPANMVVLLHGWGANGADLIGLADQWMDSFPETLFIAPDAPEVCDANPMGRQWFGMGDWAPETIVQGAHNAHPKLDKYLQEKLAEYDLAPAQCVLAGFSQGMMMALHTGLRQKTPLAGILGYSGTLLGVESLKEAEYPKSSLCLIHGTADTVVPVELHDFAVSALGQMGYEVESLKVPGLPHGIDETGLEKGEDFLKRCLS
jgi:phospholipase/carboxylesterase